MRSEKMSIPNKWELTNIGSCLSLIKNGTSLIQNNEKKGYKVSRIETISDRFVNFEKVGYVDTDLDISEYLIRKGDILFSHINSVKHIGKVAQFSSDEELYHGMNLLLLRFNKKVNNRYGYYYLSSYKFKSYCERLCKQAVNQASLNQKDVNQIPILLPTFPEQHKIAEILSTVDADIEKTDAIIKETQQLKKGLMEKLFTDGIGHTRFKQTKIGRIPKEWDVEKIGAVAKFQGGYAFKSKDYCEKGIRSLRISNVSFSETLWNEVAFLSCDYKEKFSDYLLAENDIILAMTRPIISGGIKIAKLSKEDVPSLLNQRVGRFQIEKNLCTDFLYYLLFSEGVQKTIFNFSVGSNQPNISSKQIENIIIPFPPPDEQLKIANILSEVESKLKNEVNYKSELEQLKKGLLQVLLTGKVRVKV